ncbi:MAG: hypothetical protein JNM89_05920 [Hyphomicrobiaceae bacterium]|nr:hypothetical protein [Hyphomicrobiaceae bacterium]
MSGDEAVKTLGSTNGESGDTASPSAAHGDEAPSAVLSAEATEAIAVGLREVYAELLNAPLPDRFSKLLAELTNAEDVSKKKV